MSLITINDGPLIRSTTYWQTSQAARGAIYLSVNAGAVRLLFPFSAQHRLAEIRGARSAAIQLADAKAVGAVHILIETRIGYPFFLSLPVSQIDRSLPASEAGRWVTLHIYADAGLGATRLHCSMPALIRGATREIDPSIVPEPPVA